MRKKLTAFDIGGPYSMPTIGVIGTGDFSTYLIAALRKGGFGGRILLSPYSRDKAETIAATHNCTVAPDDASMLAEADWILLAVRPEQLANALPRLVLRPKQVLISAVAGVTIAELRATIGEDILVVRIMPSSYIDTISEGLIPIFPASQDIEAVLNSAGKVVTFDTEDQFELAMIGACLAGWMYRFVATLEAWFLDRGLTPAQARLIVAGNIAGSTGYALARQDVSLELVSDLIATQGTYTEAGLDHLLRRQAALPWVEALDIVFARLNLVKT
ncbi:NAD(P)-binding domain-containing protein (plasmid) [Mesorhizobium sp. AR07]|uniref:NAD(P)-binding domain-containing protein n=1 Tax=Mesorhizobium sp. AR07 TaxID=2865838 RepID=UPI00215E1F93|nr:NAD(P)-binding domain-containing protein [Mesorhizobium sp. AR07]UVK48387.1 NAD(P)-binding domain-containing protein [Mesorhizobium sp. AR07]